MKRSKNIVAPIVIICMMLAGQANAQFGKIFKNRVKETAKEKTIQKSEDLVERGIDEGANAIWRGITQPKKKKAKYNQGSEVEEYGNELEEGEMNDMDSEAFQEKLMGMLGGNSENINTEDFYSFDIEVNYMIYPDTSDMKKFMNYSMMLNPVEDYTGAKINEVAKDGNGNKIPMGMITIMDPKNNAMIMIMEEYELANVMPFDGFDTSGDEKQDDVAIEKTGRTKQILGYDCDEYNITSSDMTGIVWVAPDIKGFNNSSLFTAMNQKGGNGNNYSLAGMQGMAMEMYFNISKPRKKGGGNFKMVVTDIKENPVEYNMADYRKTSMGGKMFNPGGKKK